MKKFIVRYDLSRGYLGKTLYRIEGVGAGFEGELGGWVEKESNLAQEGLCWVANEAIVCDDALVCDNAYISDSAVIGGKARVGGICCIYDRVIAFVKEFLA